MVNMLAAATSESVTTVLGVLGSVVTWLFSQISEVVTIVMENPLLLIPIGVIMAYTVIAIFKRLF